MYVQQPKQLDPVALPKGKIAIVAARFNTEIVDALIAGAITALREQGLTESDWTIYRVPGAFELPLACQTAVANPHISGIIALGAVIRGDTPHFDYVCNACTDGILQIQLAAQKPVMFGVLTTDTIAQAQCRAGGRMGNKGHDTAMGLLTMFATLGQIENA